MRKILFILAAALTMVTQGAWATGELTGKFSVNATGKQVVFSQGNLQASYYGSEWVWAIAGNQYDYIGEAPGNTSVTNTAPFINSDYKTVDLFGWVGASSTWTDVNMYGITSSTDNVGSADGYGTSNIECLKSDWGNTIGAGWRTLSINEWNYLLTGRTNADNLRTLATVHGVSGLLIMPDGWTNSGILTITTASYTTNTISDTNWTTLESEGCVFLPAAHRRLGNGVSTVDGDVYGHYWSTTPNSINEGQTPNAYDISFSKTHGIDAQHSQYRRWGSSVRLVKDCYTASFATGNDNTGWTIAPTSAIQGPTVTVSYSGEHKVKSVSVKAAPGTLAWLKEAVDAADATELATLNSTYLGKVIGADGKLYNTATDATTAGTTASALIVYLGKEGEENTSYQHGLAIAMRNGSWSKWYTSNSGTCVNQTNNIATALGYKNGIACTETLTNGHDDHTHAAATAAKNFGATRPLGTSGWFLPSIGQWNLIVQGLASKKKGSPVTTDLKYEIRNETYYYSNLNSVITDAGGVGFVEGSYSASTECITTQCWTISFMNGWAQGLSKKEGYNLRAVLAF